ncbi:SEL1-like repeat protein, partial [Klebsiella pneumoniae]|nr:SEL1-like repeat protein [Klebsiella pneumoniae]
MAARFKNTDALYKLSTMYEHGKGVKKNDEIAEYYLMTAFQSLNELPDTAKLEYPSVLFAMGKKFLAIGEEEGDFEVAY